MKVKVRIRVFCEVCGKEIEQSRVKYVYDRALCPACAKILNEDDLKAIEDAFNDADWGDDYE